MKNPDSFRRFKSALFIAGLIFPCISAAQSLKPPIGAGEKNGLSPKDALANFSTYEGFQIVQSAAEPDVRQPVAMTIDERGRVWIAEAYEYPKRAVGDVGKDRILIFEDKNGDGVFDDRKVFCEGLNLVSGLEVGFGGVWVGAAPYLLFIPDANGDDQADGKPEILLDGFGFHDTHETLNSFTWGPDGWLYGCHGVFTHSKVGKPGTAEKDRVPMNAAVWRFHPIRQNFEVFAHGTSNPWGVDFNDYGQSFITACVVPHLFHVIQGARYQRQAGQHFDPHTYDDIKTCADHLHYKGDQWANSRDGSSSDFGGGHAHCGLSIYLGDSFPDQFRGKLLFNNLHGHRVNQELVERKGSGYVGKHQPDFLFSNDRQHMGVSLRYGPDGGLFLTDWYDSQTCHNVNGEIWNRTNGRIYKINYGKSAAKPVNLRESSDLDLVKLQLHRNDWHVRNARRLLQERASQGKLDGSSASAALKKILFENPDETRQLRALWALHAIHALSENDLLEGSRMKGEYVRAWSIQLLMEAKAATPQILQRFTDLAASDPSPLVRLYLAAALQRLPLDQRWEISAALLEHEEDSADHNLPLMLWYGVSDLVLLDPSRALSLAKNARVKTVRQYLIRRISEDERGRDGVLASIKGSAETSWNVDVLAGIAMAVAKEKSLKQPVGWVEASKIFAGLGEPDQRRNFERVATVFGDTRMIEKFQRTLLDRSSGAEDRTAALDNLVRMQPANLGTFLIRLSSQLGDSMRADWIRSLALVKDPAVVPFLIEIFPQLGAREKEAAVQALAGSEAGARKLAEGLASGSVKREEISAFIARQMRAYDHAEITSVVEKYWGRISSGQAADKLKEIEKWSKALSPKVLAKADLRKGREVFQATCFACHQLFGEGMKIGPDLTGSNRGELSYLLENIVDPSSLVGLDYQLHSIEKTDGQRVTGLLREKTSSALSIGMLGGTSVLIPVSEIKNHQVAETSMMPEGLLANLTEEQVRDLIGYLQSPTQVPLPVAGEILIGDDHIKVAEVNRGTIQQQSMTKFKADSWSAGTQLWWTDGQPGDRVVLQFESATEGRYDIHAVFSKAHDYGTFRLKINGQPAIDSIDLFHRPDVITTGDVPAGAHLIKAGLNQLIIEMLEPNPAATPKNMFGLDHLRMVPAE